MTNDLTTSEKSEETTIPELANIVNKVLVSSLNWEKLTKKFEKHPRPDNLKPLKVEKCNPEIWNEMVHSKTTT